MEKSLKISSKILFLITDHKKRKKSPQTMSNTKLNFYDILNASSTATIDELKLNYKQLILQCHPDKLLQQQQQQQQQQSEQEIKVKLENNDDPNNLKFVAITEAWNCLKDPLKRKQYDAELLLNKFHTHNNIYAHIKLNEMKKQLNTEVDSGDDDDDDDNVDDKVEEVVKGMESLKADAEEVVCNTTSKYLYTYDCRCGGQYIVDESAEQYCRTGNHGSEVINNDSNNVDFNGVDDDDDDADNITQNNNSPNNTNECKNNGGGGVAETAAGGGGGGSEGVIFNGDNEEGGELIVECSECSLVIILNG